MCTAHGRTTWPSASWTRRSARLVSLGGKSWTSLLGGVRLCCSSTSPDHWLSRYPWQHYWGLWYLLVYLVMYNQKIRASDGCLSLGTVFESSINPQTCTVASNNRYVSVVVKRFGNGLTSRHVSLTSISSFFDKLPNDTISRNYKITNNRLLSCGKELVQNVLSWSQVSQSILVASARGIVV